MFFCGGVGGGLSLVMELKKLNGRGAFWEEERQYQVSEAWQLFQNQNQQQQAEKIRRREEQQRQRRETGKEEESTAETTHY